MDYNKITFKNYFQKIEQLIFNLALTINTEYLKKNFRFRGPQNVFQILTIAILFLTIYLIYR